MNDALWVMSGGILGWIGYSFMSLSEGRSKIVAIIIGAAGGFIGGKLVAPMFGAAVLPTGAFSVTALIFAALVAAAFVYLGNMSHNRWGV